MNVEKIREIIAENLHCDLEEVTMEARLAEDLQADSLDAVELNMALEEESARASAMSSWPRSRRWAISIKLLSRTPNRERTQA